VGLNWDCLSILSKSWSALKIFWDFKFLEVFVYFLFLVLFFRKCYLLLLSVRLEHNILPSDQAVSSLIKVVFGKFPVKFSSSHRFYRILKSIPNLIQANCCLWTNFKFYFLLVQISLSTFWINTKHLWFIICLFSICYFKCFYLLL